MQNIQVKVQDVVLKPLNEVFDAVVNPVKLSKFFISRASGPIKENENITWYFDDVGGECSVAIGKIVRDNYISFEWEASGSKAKVELKLKSIDSNKTLIQVTEAGFPLDKNGVTQALGQTQGWTDFICCMKAYLYAGINLREGREPSIYKDSL